MPLPKELLNALGLAAFPADAGAGADQGLNTTDSPTFADGSFASLFNGSAGCVALASHAVIADSAGQDSDAFFNGGGGGYWGSPTFDASNLTGAPALDMSLMIGVVSEASFASSSIAADANTFFVYSGWGMPEFDGRNVGGYADGLTAQNACVLSDEKSSLYIYFGGVSYYPHVTAGVLTFTDTP